MSELENQENGEPKKGKPRGTPFQKGNKFGYGSKQKKESLSLPNYIKRKTNQGKILTNFYIGILKTAVSPLAFDYICCYDSTIYHLIT